VGSLVFSIKKIIKELTGSGSFEWVNLYGAPLGCSGDNTKRMNEHPESASTWKGRILVHFNAEETKHPEMKIEDLDPLIKVGLVSWMTNNEYEVIAEIGCAMCIPDTKKYKIKIAI
jgi:hypothetical protein